MPNDKQRLCRQQGFTLVEVMIALFIFMVIALGLAQGEIAALRAHNDNLLRDQALSLAEDQLNNLRANPPAVLPACWALANRQVLNVEMRGSPVQFASMFCVRALPVQARGLVLTRFEVVVGWNQGNDPALPAPAGLGMNRQVSLNTIQ